MFKNFFKFRKKDSTQEHYKGYFICIQIDPDRKRDKYYFIYRTKRRTFKHSTARYLNKTICMEKAKKLIDELVSYKA